MDALSIPSWLLTMRNQHAALFTVETPKMARSVGMPGDVCVAVCWNEGKMHEDGIEPMPSIQKAVAVPSVSYLTVD